MRAPASPTTISRPGTPPQGGEAIPPRPSPPVHRHSVAGVHRAADDVRWYGAGETIVIGQYRIRDPFTYGARRVSGGPDRTCIDFGLPVTGPPATSIASSAAYVAYRDLTAPERGAYLQWLAAGRTRFPNRPAFMSMFLEGIERRLLLDNADGNLLACELLRLLPLCPADDGARTLIYKLLAYATAVHHVTDLSLPSLDVLVDQLDVKNNMTIDVTVLGWLSAWQKPLPAKWALRLLWRVRVPQRLGTTREFAQHGTSFVEAYGRAFPAGFVLPLPLGTRRVAYYPASHAVLAHFDWSACPPATIPDALTSNQLAPLLKLWRTCSHPAVERKPPDSKRVPEQPPATEPIGVVLDPRAVQRVLSDTKAAQSLLAHVFADEDGQAQPPSAPHHVPSPAAESAPPQLPDRYRPVLQALLDQPDWERSAFVALVRRHHLMAADTIATINTWASDALGDLLIEDNGSLHVNRDLVETHG